MKIPKAILFDMGGTLISYNNFDPLKGTKKIIENCKNPNNVSPETVQNFATELNKEFKEIRDDNNIEIHCRSFHKLIYQMYGLEYEKSPFEYEILFKKNAWEIKKINRRGSGIT
ncbi:MAG: hypothetical protein ACOC1O_03130 [bacterium]